MNDFTKEELKTLMHWGIDRLQAIGAENFTEESGYDLYAKLCAMIATYCEHTDTEMDCDGGISLICRDCKAVLIDI